MEQRHILSPGATRQHWLSRATIAEILARGHDPRGRGDAFLEGEPAPGANLLNVPATPAAVLVPLVEREAGLTVLLTQRTAHLANHPGQISFPGGRLEECDQGDFIACALRETHEEIGLPHHAVTIVGRLDEYVTGTGFSVVPVVGMVAPPFQLQLDAFEVAEVFEVPLDFLIDTGNHRLCRREVAGRTRPFWAMSWEERLIWGATAGILVNLSEVLAPK